MPRTHSRKEIPSFVSTPVYLTCPEGDSGRFVAFEPTDVAMESEVDFKGETPCLRSGCNLSVYILPGCLVGYTRVEVPDYDRDSVSVPQGFSVSL